MFANKLWDEDKNDTVSNPWERVHKGCHGKGKGKHHGHHHSND